MIVRRRVVHEQSKPAIGLSWVQASWVVDAVSAAAAVMVDVASSAGLAQRPQTTEMSRWPGAH